MSARVVGLVRFEFLRSDMNEKIGFFLVEGLFEVPVRGDVLEPHFFEQSMYITPPERKHVQMELRTIGKLVTEASETFVDVFGLGFHILTTVIVGMLRCEAPIEQPIVVALVQNQHTVVPKGSIELGQCATTIALFEQMRE